jgi:hypothetical protein
MQNKERQKRLKAVRVYGSDRPPIKSDPQVAK